MIAPITHFWRLCPGRQAFNPMMSMLVAAATFLVAGHAFAQTPPNFTTDDAGRLFGTEFGDPFSSQFLNEIFGPLFPASNGGVNETAFSLIIGYFNVIMLAVGGLLFFYNVTAGVLQSAHEGEVLGRRWSSLWSPLRVILAIGLLVPLPNYGGYNTVQAGVAFVVKGSTLIASTVWKVAAKHIIDGNVPVAAGAAKFPDEIVQDAWNMGACIAVANAQFAAAGSDMRVSVLTAPVKLSSFSNRTVPAIQTIVTGSQSGANICGAFRAPETPSFLDSIEASQRAAIASAFQQAHMKALVPLVNEMIRLAEIVTQDARKKSPSPTPITDPIVKAVKKANTDLRTGIGEVTKLIIGTTEGNATPQSLARQRLVQYATGENCDENSADVSKDNCYGQGWIGAGSWYMMVARLNNEMLAITTSVPEVHTTPRYAVQQTGMTLDSIINDSWFNIASANDLSISAEETVNLLKVLSDRFAAATAAMGGMGYQLDRTIVEDARPTESSIWEMFNIPRDWVDGVTDFFRPSNWADDPMVGLTRLGDFFILVSGSTIAIISVAAAVPAIGGGAEALGAMLMPFLALMAGAGSTLAIVIPMMPFLLWVLAVTGYFLLVVEAVVASALWAVAHLRMDGEGISGDSARQGYLLILALLMTPVLMVFGYIVGMVIFRVTSGIIDIGFFYALSGLGGSPFTWLVAMAVLSVLVVLIYMIMIERSFSLVSEFPTRVLAWIGTRADVTRGEESRMIAAATAGGLAARQVTQAGSSGGLWAGRKWRKVVERRNSVTESPSGRITAPGDTGDSGGSD